MRKQWVALLSMLGLAGPITPVRSQVLKGSANQTKAVHNQQVKTTNGSNAVQKTGGSSKLNLNQQTLRQQNKSSINGGKQADTMTPSAYCNANRGRTDNFVIKGNAKNQLTPPPPGSVGNQQITKGSPNNAITKGSPNNAITKGSANQQITKGSPNNAITKGSPNNAITKGSANQQLTKGRTNNAITKGTAVQTTAAAGPK
ncbi:MAG: hypothetical protein LAP21_15270 [Acidobacteriia bacterium]|nr:hypothetical protein [Terriglobia bacterium]